MLVRHETGQILSYGNQRQLPPKPWAQLHFQLNTIWSGICSFFTEIHGISTYKIFSSKQVKSIRMLKATTLRCFRSLLNPCLICCSLSPYFYFLIVETSYIMTWMDKHAKLHKMEKIIENKPLICYNKAMCLCFSPRRWMRERESVYNWIPVYAAVLPGQIIINKYTKI